jgi:hypothetical protein
VLEQDEVHGDEGGHEMMFDQALTWKRRKRKIKIEMIKAKV